MFIAQNQARPRHRAVKHVGLNHARQAPMLSMRDLNLLIQQDAFARLPQPRTELDVLNAGSAIAGVEPFQFHECRTSYAAAPRPKRRGVAITALMNVVVQQVLVLRNQIRARRSRIVRTEHGRDVRIRFECLQKLIERMRGSSTSASRNTTISPRASLQPWFRAMAGPTLRGMEHPRPVRPRHVGVLSVDASSTTTTS